MGAHNVPHMVPCLLQLRAAEAACITLHMLLSLLLQSETASQPATLVCSRLATALNAEVNAGKLRDLSPNWASELRGGLNVVNVQMLARRKLSKDSMWPLNARVSDDG